MRESNRKVQTDRLRVTDKRDSKREQKRGMDRVRKEKGDKETDRHKQTNTNKERKQRNRKRKRENKRQIHKDQQRKRGRQAKTNKQTSRKISNRYKGKGRDWVNCQRKKNRNIKIKRETG